MPRERVKDNERNQNLLLMDDEETGVGTKRENNHRLKYKGQYSQNNMFDIKWRGE